jgi:hypothetical protein
MNEHLKELTYDQWMEGCAGFIAGARKHIKMSKSGIFRSYYLSQASLALRRADVCWNWAVSSFLEDTVKLKYIKELFLDKTDLFFD